jgi:hypothetical protein
MWTSCQQTRIANAAEKLAREQERLKLIAAKRELQRVAFEIIQDLSLDGEMYRVKTKKECLDFVKTVHDRLNSVADNYYLQQYPDHAKAWAKIVSSYEMYLVPKLFDKPYTMMTATNTIQGIEWTDANLIDLVQKESSQRLNELVKIYGNLRLANYTFEEMPKTAVKR